jgi:hypothetical protein
MSEPLIGQCPRCRNALGACTCPHATPSKHASADFVARFTDYGEPEGRDAPPPDYDVYVAASWRTPRQQEVVAVLRSAGLRVYDFRNPRPDDDGFSWRELDPAWESWTPDQYIAGLQHPIAVAGFEQDMRALRGAQCVVLVQPSGRSAALEFGWARGAGKPGAVLLAAGQEPELMLKMANLLTTSLDQIVEWTRGSSQAGSAPPIDGRCPGCGGAVNETGGGWWHSRCLTAFARGQRGAGSAGSPEVERMRLERDAWRQRAEFAESELEKAEGGAASPSSGEPEQALRDIYRDTECQWTKERIEIYFREAGRAL